MSMRQLGHTKARRGGSPFAGTLLPLHRRFYGRACELLDQRLRSRTHKKCTVVLGEVQNRTGEAHDECACTLGREERKNRGIAQDRGTQPGGGTHRLADDWRWRSQRRLRLYRRGVAEVAHGRAESEDGGA